MPNPCPWKNGGITIWPITEGDKGVHAFPKVISPKLNIIAWLVLFYCTLIRLIIIIIIIIINRSKWVPKNSVKDVTPHKTANTSDLQRLC